MKTKQFIFIYLALIATLVVINACSISKRVYRPGYNIEWLGSAKSQAKKELNYKYLASHSSGEISNPLAGNLTASSENTIHVPRTFNALLTDKQSVKKKNIRLLNQDPCDTLLFRNGLKIIAKVIEISATEIRYKMCDNQGGPLFIKTTNEITSIYHANGSITDMSPVPASTNNNQNQSNNQQKVQTTSNGSSGKSQLVALLLCGFIGFLGIHRFYLGYPGIGVLMLLTLGCCGILAIVDFVRILMDDLKPADGDYSEKL